MRLTPDGKIEDAWFDGDGCCVSQSASSMLMESIEGKTIDEVKSFTAQQMLDLFQAKLTPNRQKCCLLSWRVVQSALFSPLHGDDEDDSPATFNGPNLGDES